MFPKTPWALEGESPIVSILVPKVSLWESLKWIWFRGEGCALRFFLLALLQVHCRAAVSHGRGVADSKTVERLPKAWRVKATRTVSLENVGKGRLGNE